MGEGWEERKDGKGLSAVEAAIREARILLDKVRCLIAHTGRRGGEGGEGRGPQGDTRG